MNLIQFIEKYRTPIANQVARSYPPIYHPASAEALPRLLRKPLGGQIHALNGVVLSLDNNRGTTLVGEMGTGKTFLGAAGAHAAGMTNILVLCPPHLTEKWQREVKETVPTAKTAIVKSIHGLRQLAKSRGRPGRPLYIIMSREQAKLGFRWKPAYYKSLQTIHGRIAREQNTELPIYAPACVDCRAILEDNEGIPLTHRQLAKKKTSCGRCGAPAWSADNQGPKRYPLADYIKNQMKGFFDLVIADEVHEYKGRGSAQGIAAGVLADTCAKTLTLTGTLAGGYSSTLFYLLYRFSPEIRSQFQHNEEAKWIKRYGFLQHTSKHSDDQEEDGRASRRRSYRKQTKELPGLAPSALFHLIPNTVFLRLTDVADDLPDYEEQLMLLHMERSADGGPSQGLHYDILYRDLRTAVLRALQRGSQRLLSLYLQSLLAFPDACVKGETVLDPDLIGKEGVDPVIAQVPPLPEDKYYPKEQALAELIAREKLHGRRVLVYVTHTGTRDITGRLSRKLRDFGINAAVLKADTVSPDKRENWIQQEVEKGVDAIICHPRLVQTGLDLIHFPTIAWYETDYSVYTMRQASRRSWRIGQKRPVKVIFMAYRATLQAEALKLVAQKLQSSLAVEGELPEEGLAAYGDTGKDMMMALAKHIMSAAESDDNSIESLFAETRRKEAAGEQFLVSQDWHAPAPEPDAPAFNENRQRSEEKTTFSWAEFLKETEPQQRPQEKEAPQPSLFGWALEKELTTVA